ncbi:hypothetical protein SAMN04489798_4019 [Pseudomonas arsenicoxydans]|uniref:Uncharacterized protein n=1 Tax=Pseudomonas arsenicoxydans TaxID=702115 RepID=A0A1H0MYB8_9PSED|nr:hypothetical protein [Pseudomonas arsenicoxydans]SDO85110.1 hypothetical protein SAMN04489798_4019 [Pseudomonas arsenicoxydans]
MKDETTQRQDQSGAPIDRNDPAIDPQMPGDEGAGAQRQQSSTGSAQSADAAVDQKNLHDDNDNEFSPGFKPHPDRPKPSDETDADIDTDGG